MPSALSLNIELKPIFLLYGFPCTEAAASRADEKMPLATCVLVSTTLVEGGPCDLRILGEGLERYPPFAWRTVMVTWPVLTGADVFYGSPFPSWVSANNPTGGAIFQFGSLFVFYVEDTHRGFRSPAGSAKLASSLSVASRN
jgi:hypothetical protein